MQPSLEDYYAGGFPQDGGLSNDTASGNPYAEAIAGVSPPPPGLSGQFGGSIPPDPALQIQPPTPPAPYPNQSTSSSAGGSVAHSGLDTNMFDYVSGTKGMSAYDRQLAGDKNQNAQLGNKLAAEQAGVTDEKKSAAEGLVGAQVAQINGEGELNSQLATMQKQNALDDAKDYATAQMATQKYMADYQTASKELAAMSVNPGRAYSAMTNAQRAGTLITAFVTDYLGSKGIKTSGMDAINRGIDLDIQAQRDAIEQKKGEVSGKQNLWQMQRAQSQSDYEATVRTRGLMLEAAKTEMIGKMAGFKSDVAQAQLPGMKAAFDQEKLASDTELAKYVQGENDKAAQIRTTQRGQSLDAAASANRFAFEKAQAQDAKNAAGKQQWDPNLFIRDAQGNVAIQAANKESRNELQTKVTGSEQFIKGLHELTADIREAGSTYSGYGSKWTNNFVQSKYKSKYNQLLSDYVKAQSGTAAGEAEVKRLEKVIPFADLSTAWLSGEDGSKVIERVIGAGGYDRVQNLLESVKSQGIPVPPEVAAQYKGDITPGAFGATSARGDELHATAESAPSASATADTLIGDAEQWKNDGPVLIDKGTTVYDHAAELYKQQHIDFGPGVGDKVTVPVWFDRMDKLFNVVADPQTSKADKDRAIEFFSNKANPRQGIDFAIKPSTQDLEEQAAAQYYMLELAGTPNAN